MDELKRKYDTQKKGAKQRGVEFDLTFDEWKDIWDGKFHKRGNASDQLMMLRTRDEGGYSVGNVRLGSPKENVQEQAVAQKVKTSQNWNMSKTQYALKPPVHTSWVKSRGYVFDEYIEEDD